MAPRWPLYFALAALLLAAILFLLLVPSRLGRPVRVTVIGAAVSIVRVLPVMAVLAHVDRGAGSVVLGNSLRGEAIEGA